MPCVKPVKPWPVPVDYNTGSNCEDLSLPGFARVRYDQQSVRLQFAVGLGVLLLANICVCAQPANDQCSGAIILQPGVPFVMSTADATDAADPASVCGIPITGGVWFRFTPASNGLVRVSTCGSDFDTILQVLSGTCAALTPVIDCNDDPGPACAGFQASVQFFGSAGVTYWIVAGDFIGMGGNLSIVAYAVDRPPNDDCIGAVTLQPGVPFAMSTTNATATGDSVPACQTNFGSGVWFKFTPQTSGTVTISTCGSDFNTVLQVYSGSCGALVPIPSGCNDSGGSACPSANSAVLQFPGIGGQTYWILAGGAFGTRGSLRIVADPLPQVNDMCSGAINLEPRLPLSIDTFLAGNVGDPAPLCQTNFGRGIWFTLTPGSNGMVTVSTCGTGFDTVLQVYTGDCNALIPLTGGCNDDNGADCGGSRASGRFQGTRGVTYRILVGGYGGARGVVNIFADYPPSSPSISISPQAGSAVLLHITGVPGFAYVLQTSTNRLDWLDLADVTIEANGQFNFSHTNELNSPTRFFRLRSP